MTEWTMYVLWVAAGTGVLFCVTLLLGMVLGAMAKRLGLDTPPLDSHRLAPYDEAHYVTVDLRRAVERAYELEKEQDGAA